MAKTILRNDTYYNDGRIFVENGDFKWNNNEQNMPIDVAGSIEYRIPLDIPKGGWVQSAQFSVRFALKDSNTVPQSATADVYCEYPCPAYPSTAANNHYIGPAGPTHPQAPRQVLGISTTASINYTTVGQSDIMTVDVTNFVKAIVNRPDFVPGEHMGIVFRWTSEVGNVSLASRRSWGNSAAQHPQLTVYYIEPVSGAVDYDLNVSPGQTFELSTINWTKQNMFDTRNPNVTLTSSTSLHHSGGASLKVTVAADTQTPARPFGVTTPYAAKPGRTYVFSGWIWVSGNITGDVRPNFEWVTEAYNLVTARDQWVPFSTQPLTVENQEGLKDIWPAISVDGPSAAGQFIHLDDLTLTESMHPNFPFTGHTPDQRYISHDFANVGDPLSRSLRIAERRTNVIASTPELDAMTTSYGNWSNVGTGAAEFYPVSGGVQIRFPSSPAGTRKAKFAKTMDLQGRKHLGIQFTDQTTGRPEFIVESITYSDGYIHTGPYMTYNQGGHKFYEVQPEHGSITEIVFAVDNIASESSLFIYSLYATNGAVAGTRAPSPKWYRRPDGMWQRVETERQSLSYDDLKLTPSSTWAWVDAQNKTWDQLEGMQVI